LCFNKLKSTPPHKRRTGVGPLGGGSFLFFVLFLIGGGGGGGGGGEGRRIFIPKRYQF